jgi:GNAT superfamily N-acetyltransferase
VANLHAPATIRDARADDIPRLLELYFQLSGDGQQPEREVRPLAVGHRAALERIAADPNADLFVLEAKGRVVATYALYVLPNLSHGGRPFAIVENVVVDDALRGHGLGRLLMEDAVARARAAGCYKVGLTSNSRRAPAHAFYTSIGFEPTHQGFTRYFDD